jgi:hypothetical protein
MSDIVDALENVESAVQSVDAAVGRVEDAVKSVRDRWSTAQWVLVFFAGLFFWSLPQDIWHAKWRYALTYGISSEKVIVSARDHDCDFLAAPLGEKYCHYERQVQTTRWATSPEGQPIVSYDEGKTWAVGTPEAGVTAPKYHSIVTGVYISWNKVSE